MPTDRSLAGIRQYIDGLSYLRQHIDTFSIAIQKAILGFFIIGFFQVAQVTIAEQHFPIGEGGSISMGLIYVMAGIGSGLSPILGRNWARDRDRRLRLMIALRLCLLLRRLSNLLNLDLAARRANRGALARRRRRSGLGPGYAAAASNRAERSARPRILHRIRPLYALRRCFVRHDRAPDRHVAGRQRRAPARFAHPYLAD